MAFLAMLLQGCSARIGAALVSFVWIYFSWVMAASDRLMSCTSTMRPDIDPVQAPGAWRPCNRPCGPGGRASRDALVAVAGAGQQDGRGREPGAREWQREDYESLARLPPPFPGAQADQTRGCLAGALGQRFIPHVARQQRASEALETWVSCCVKRKLDFKPDSAQLSYELKQQAWKTGKPRACFDLQPRILEALCRQHSDPAMRWGWVVRAYKQGVE